MSISLRNARMPSLRDKLSQQAEAPKEGSIKRAVHKSVETITRKKKK